MDVLEEHYKNFPEDRDWMESDESLEFKHSDQVANYSFWNNNSPDPHDPVRRKRFWVYWWSLYNYVIKQPIK